MDRRREMQGEVGRSCKILRYLKARYGYLEATSLDVHCKHRKRAPLSGAGPAAVIVRVK